MGEPSNASFWSSTEFISWLLGSTRSSAPAGESPDGIDYIAIMVCKSTGSLANIAACSGACLEGPSLETRPTLSLLPRSKLWTAGALETGSVGLVAAIDLPSESPTDQLLELKTPLQLGYRSFVAVSARANPSIEITVIMGRRERPPNHAAHVEVAQTVLDTAIVGCMGSVLDMLALSEMLVNAPGRRPLSSNASLKEDSEGEKEEEPSRPQWEQDGSCWWTEAQWAVPRRPSPPQSSPWTLCFAEPQLESQFKAWHSRRMTKIDILSHLVFFLCVLHGYLAPSSPFLVTSMAAQAANLGHVFFRCLPLALLLTHRSRRWYQSLRETLIVYTLLCAGFWRNSIDAIFNAAQPMPIEAFDWPIMGHRLFWLPAICFMYQARFVVMAPALLAAFAAHGCGFPVLSTSARSIVPLPADAGAGVVYNAIFSLVLPLLLLWVMEMGARDRFLAQIELKKKDGSDVRKA